MSILELNVKNLSKTLLTQDIGLTETSFKVADAGALPNPPFLITVEGEIMRVGSKNVSTNTLSNVLRGREGTSPAPHSSGTVVENRFTAGTYNEIKQTVTSHLAEHLRIEIGVTPPDNPNSKSFWLEDLGESIDFGSGSALLIGNASTDGSDDVWFDENI